MNTTFTNKRIQEPISRSPIPQKKARIGVPKFLLLFCLLLISIVATRNHAYAAKDNKYSIQNIVENYFNYEAQTTQYV